MSNMKRLSLDRTTSAQRGEKLTWKRLFGSRSSSVSDDLTSPPHIVTPISPSVAPSQSFLENALSLLPPQDQDTIRANLPIDPTDIGSALDSACQLAQNLNQLWLRRQNTQSWNFLGQTISPRDLTHNMVLWLERFKAVGDVAANADPIHAGLPWAAIRLLLEVRSRCVVELLPCRIMEAVADRVSQVAVSGAVQATTLLSGIEVALYMITRLKAYHAFLRALPSSSSKSNFETSLTKFYAIILQFLAHVGKAHQQTQLTRTLGALWKVETIKAFERECDKLGTRADIEASICQRELSLQHRAGASAQKETLQAILRELEEVHSIAISIEAVQDKLDLAKLPIAKEAAFDSYDEDRNERCMQNTRVELLRQIVSWAEDTDGKSIFWLCGQAGIGKSTISRTVAQKLRDKGRLGASFFFKRGEGDRGHARQFFPTIAEQLAAHVPGLLHLLAKTLDANPQIADKSLKEHFEKLLLTPLSQVPPQARRCWNLTIVVDALDECEREDDVRTILRLLSRLEDTRCHMPVSLRLFVTSRPELPIRLGFAEMGGAIHHDVDLHKATELAIESDISLYLTNELSCVRSDYAARYPNFPLPADWPGEEKVQILVGRAMPLFIIAATVCRFIADPRANPKKRLDAVLRHPQAVSSSQLDRMYLPILDQLQIDHDDLGLESLITEFHELVGPIVLLAEPLSSKSLATLLNIPLEDVCNRLDWLHSVLSVPTEQDELVRILHLSFRDFLVDPDKCGKNRFWVNEPEVHGQIASRCLDVLKESGCLMEDICGLPDPGVRRREVTKAVVDAHIPPAVSYAARYWVFHLEHSDREVVDGDEIHRFLESYFLNWLEVLCWLGRMSESFAQLTAALSRVAVSVSTQSPNTRRADTVSQREKSSSISRLLRDAKRFVIQNRHIANLSPLRLYTVAKPFDLGQDTDEVDPKDPTLEMVRRPSRVIVNWSADSQMLQGHTEFVNGLSFSPDGLWLASASDDSTIRLWDLTTASDLLTFEGHTDSVNTVVFSPDCRSLASASGDDTVRLWDTTSGKELRAFRGHTDFVHGVAFSPDGLLLLSASGDKTIRLWDAMTGEELKTLSGHKDIVWAVAFSPDGRLMASASRDTTLKIWDVETGEQLKILEGHTAYVNLVVFSPDGQTLASASGDKSVRLWSVKDGKEMSTLEGHTDFIAALALWPGDQWIASVQNDDTLRLWCSATGDQIKTFIGQSDYVNIAAFSSDGRSVAAALGDMSIRVWKAETRDEVTKLY